MLRTVAYHLLDRQRLLRVALIWCVLAAALLALRTFGQLQVGWTDGAARPLGEDFVNFWSGAYLSAHGEWQRIYDLTAFHQFQSGFLGGPVDFYHYSYPPVTWLLTAPLAVLPYPVALAMWQTGGWLAQALALRRIAPKDWLILSLAPPAIFINSIGGQNGCWLAAALAWGLILLRERPVLAGAILAVFVAKPQLGWLIPLALLAGRQHLALASFAITAIGLLLASILVFGVEAWVAYLHQAKVLKLVILEHGSGTWHRMLSVFVLVRHAGLSVFWSYALQLLASAVVAIAVCREWRRTGPEPKSFSILICGVLAGALYVSDYDYVMAIFAAAWMWPHATHGTRLAIATVIVLPLISASLALASGLAIGAPIIWVALALLMKGPATAGARALGGSAPTGRCDIV